MSNLLQIFWTSVAILVTLTLVSSQIDPSCDYYQELEVGSEYFIYNKEYPQNYAPWSSCRWSARSPVGTVISISCCDVVIPYSVDCGQDHLSLSLTGDENLNYVENYCGRTILTATSYSNYLVVGLFSGSNSPGGKFLCSLSAMHPAPRSCNCGLRQETKIVGGEETGVNEFPMMAALVDATTRAAFCGASVISNRYAVTAAHCLLHQTSDNLGLLVGDHDLDSGNDTNSSQLYRLNNFVQHPFYEEANNTNDIAIVQTQKPIQFSMDVGPVCLPFKYRDDLFVGDVVTALGWGFLDFSGYKSNTLQKVDLSIVSNFRCDSALKEKILPTQICTYTSGKDSCVGDSGGPLLLQDSKTENLELVGIISYGLACATSKPAVNTRVTCFLPWITSVAHDTSYCIR